MAFDTGGRGDGTFNDLAVKGLERAAKELGATAKELSPNADGTNRADLLRQLADGGYSPIFGVGYNYGEPMDQVAKEYPKVQFVRIDGAPSTVANVAVMDFAEQEGSFLVGVAAALKSKTHHVGFIGGNESVVINRFGAGFAQGAKAEEAKAAGADIVGLDDLAAEIKAGNLNFDIVIASPDTMRVVGTLGQILGPRGLMPNPKVGTVTPDVATAVKNAKAGQVQFRVDKAGIIHGTIGRRSFDDAKLKGNLAALLDALSKAKPASSKGVYLRKLAVSSTMGVGVRVDLASMASAA